MGMVWPLNTNGWKRAAFTLWSPIYNLVAWPFRRGRKRSIRLAGIKPGERVLLVGAGTGLDLDFLPAGVEVTAVDIAPAMIYLLRRRAGRLGLAVDARVMDAQSLDFKDESFDLVVLHLILAVAPDPVRVIRESARVLRVGGRAVVLDKFVPDGRRIPFVRRLINPLAQLVGTDLTRRFEPLTEASVLRLVTQEQVGTTGLFRVALLTKAAGLQACQSG
jgi:phosphatidylethanolamine/phosphatidyl-N-methylethanolamine N-methyltransferase